MAGAVACLSDFIDSVVGIKKDDDEVLMFRGHSDKEYELIPSVFRDKMYEEKEHEMLREIQIAHPSEFSGDVGTFDMLVRVQHYSLPTRLLDVTLNPMVALYFSVKDSKNIAGEVICFKVKKDEVRYFDSDAVSCIANLANLKKHEKDKIVFAKGKREFNSQDSIDRLLQFIRVEKPHFRPEIDPKHLSSVVCVKPKKNNNRIIAQSGAFLIYGHTKKLDKHSAPGINILRIPVNAYKKPVIMADLDKFGINDSTMFPEIESAARYIRAG